MKNSAFKLQFGPGPRTFPRRAFTLIELLVVLVLFLIRGPASHAASYSITVPAEGLFFAAYHFTTNTLGNVFPAGSVPHGTQIYLWENSAQNYSSTYTYFSSLGWYPNGNYSIEPGTVFFIRNNTTTDFSVSISGTEITNSKTLSLISGNWNSGAAVRLPAEMLECPGLEAGTCPYGTGMSYPGENGDELWWWDPDAQDWAYGTRMTAGGGASISWGGGSCNGGIIAVGFRSEIWATQPGWGAFLRPVSSKNWVYDAADICEDDP